MFEEYLEEVRRELSRRLPEDDVQARLTEIEAHLREGIEGRLELGLDPAEAEREAIEAFGTVRRAATPQELEGRVAWLGLGYAIFLIYLMAGWRLVVANPVMIQVFLGGLTIAAAGFCAASYRARRPAPFKLAAVGAAATVVGTVIYGTTWLNTYAFGGMGLVPPGEADEYLQVNQNLLSQRMENRVQFDKGMFVLRSSPKGIEGLRREGGYLAPVIQPVSYNEALTYTVVARASDAVRAWRDLSTRGKEVMYIEGPRDNINAILAARASGWDNFASMVPGAVQAGAIHVSVVCVADLLFGSLGAAAFARRRRGKIVV